MTPSRGTYVRVELVGEEVQRSVCLSVSVRGGRMQLTPLCLMLSCLQVSPDRSQFFRYDTISLSCEDGLNSTGWKVKRKTLEGGVRPCSSGWGSISSGSTCIIGNIYPSDSGTYWCESVDGEQSNSVSITITDRSVILESPVLPVSEGAAVTLRCKAETKSPDHVFNFFKDEHLIGSSATGEVTIHSANKSDEGLYKCSISGGQESTTSWLSVDGERNSPQLCHCNYPGVCQYAVTSLLGVVTASLPSSPSPPPSPSPSASAPPAASCSVSVPRLMCHLLVGVPYLLSTILLGLIYRDRKRAAQTLAERRGSSDVIMEVAV